MDRVLTNEIWKEVRKRAQKANVRKAAIAYATKDLIGLQADDTLITEASERAIRSGQTDARLLRRLYDNGVIIHSHSGLHCKLVLLDRYVVIGSANMSGSDLIEASVITDSPGVRSGIASLIAQLSNRRSRLSERQIETLGKIKVLRTGWMPSKRKSKTKKIKRLGNTTWIIGVNTLIRDPTQKEQRYIDRAHRELNKRLGADDESYSWIRWGKKGRFSKECREGDTLIEITNRRGSPRRYVTRRLPVLLKRVEPACTRFYVGDPQQDSDEVNWSRFRRILKAAGHLQEVRPYSVQPLDSELAKAIDRNWTQVN